MNKKNQKPILTYIFSLAVIIIVWAATAKCMAAPLILPEPLFVLKTLFALICKKVFWQNFVSTFTRVIIAFLISIVIGSIIGLLCGISQFARNFFELPVAIIRATPVVAIILVAFFWFTSNTVPIFVTVLMTLPIIISSVTSGFINADEKLLQMSSVFCLSKIQIIRYIQLPSVIPYFVNAAVSCFGLSWKVVVAGEVLCLPKKAMGTMLEQAQVHLETAQVMAQTIVLVAVSFLLERLFSFLVKGVKNE